MNQFLKKNAKLLLLLFAVFSFAFILIACVFMTSYNRIAVEYTEAFLTDGQVTQIQGLALFCTRTGAFNYVDLYVLMFDVNENLQLANQMLLYLGAVSLVMVAIMFICANGSRKKYYISNLVSGIACPSVCIIMSIITAVFLIICVGDVSANYEALNWGSLANSDYYNRAIQQFTAGDQSDFSVSIVPLIIYIVLIVLFIAASAGLIVYTVFRYLDTKKELAASDEEGTETLEEEQENLSERMVEANV